MPEALQKVLSAQKKLVQQFLHITGKRTITPQFCITAAMQPVRIDVKHWWLNGEHTIF